MHENCKGVNRKVECNGFFLAILIFENFLLLLQQLKVKSSQIKSKGWMTINSEAA